MRMTFVGECKECHKRRLIDCDLKMDDFEFYKAALARWSARNNYLIDKWTKALIDVKKDIEELYTYSPSSERDGWIRAKELVRNDIEIFIDDLKAPALSDLDFKVDKNSFAPRFKKRVDATQIEFLDSDYVRESF